MVDESKWRVIEGRRYKTTQRRCELCQSSATRVVDVFHGDELFEFYILCDGDKCLATIKENSGV